MNRASDKMVANFLNVTRKVTETLEDMRKQELMQSRLKTSRKYLDFDDVHTPSRVRRQQSAQQSKPAHLSDKGHVKPTQRSRLVRCTFLTHGGAGLAGSREF